MQQFGESSKLQQPATRQFQVAEDRDMSVETVLLQEQEQIRKEMDLQMDEQQSQRVCIMVRNLDSLQLQQHGNERPQQMYKSEKLSIINDLGLQSPKSKETLIWRDYWKDQEKLSTTLLRTVMEGDAEKLKEIMKNNLILLDRFSYMDGWKLIHFVCNSSTPINQEKVSSSPTLSKSSVSSNPKASLSPHSSLQKSIAESVSFNQILQILIHNGCNLQAETAIKRRPLHVAVLKNAYSKVEILLRHGCLVNVVDEDFNTPLHYAAQFGYNDILQLIAKYPQNRDSTIDFSVRNKCKMGVLQCCRDQKSRQFIQKAMKLNNTVINQQNTFYLSRYPISHPQVTLRNRADIVDVFISYCENTPIQQRQFKKPIKRNIRQVGTKCSLKSGNNVDLLQKIVEASLQSYQESLNCQLIENVNNYEKLRKLGQGSFGQVFLVRRKKSSKYFAMKCLNKTQILENKLKKYVYMERRVLLTIRNPFIVHAHSFFQDKDKLYMIMELCYGGDLQTMVRLKRRLEESLVKMYAAQVCLALGCLHQQDILFRDLKPANVLVDEEGHVKIADFGLAKQANVSYSFLGSKAYLPPEMLANSEMKQHCAAIDWYLFGVFIYELLIGKPPFYNHDQAKMFRAIKEAKPELPPFLSPHSRDILIKLLEKNPHKRLGAKSDMKQIQTHPWFKDIDWVQVQKRQLPLPKPDVNFQDLKVKTFMQENIPCQQKQEDLFDKRFNNWSHYEPLK